MKYDPSKFLYWVKQLVVGRNPSLGTVANQLSQASLSGDGGFKKDSPLVLSDVIFPGTGGFTPATTAATQLIALPLGSLAQLTANTTLNVDPGFNGYLEAINWRTGPNVLAGAGGTVGFGAVINGTRVTGGTLNLAIAGAGTVAGAQVTGGPVTGNNIFTSAQSIGITVGAITTFTGGGGQIELSVVNTDLLKALPNANLVNYDTNAYGIKVPAGTTSVGTWLWTVPRDYDSQTDFLHVRIGAMQLAQATDKTDTIAVTGVRLPLGGTTVGAVQTGVVTANSTGGTQYVTLKNQWFDFIFDNLFNPSPTVASTYRQYNCLTGLQPGDVIAFTITTASNVTVGDEIIVTEITPVYDSTLVSFNDETDSFNQRWR